MFLFPLDCLPRDPIAPGIPLHYLVQTVLFRLNFLEWAGSRSAVPVHLRGAESQAEEQGDLSQRQTGLVSTQFLSSSDLSSLASHRVPWLACIYSTDDYS